VHGFNLYFIDNARRATIYSYTYSIQKNQVDLKKLVDLTLPNVLVSGENDNVDDFYTNSI
jgi:hypothetical protein